ncbi:hypothetical protein COOONC_00252 [Cooperia oncophora]
MENRARGEVNEEAVRLRFRFCHWEKSDVTIGAAYARASKAAFGDIGRQSGTSSNSFRVSLEERIAFYHKLYSKL